jgi:hypothetical protein
LQKELDGLPMPPETLRELSLLAVKMNEEFCEQEMPGDSEFVDVI